MSLRAGGGGRAKQVPPLRRRRCSGSGRNDKGLLGLSVASGAEATSLVISNRSAGSAAPPKNLLGEEVVEGFYGGEFVVFYVEDGVELGDLDYVVDFLGEAEEF